MKEIVKGAGTMTKKRARQILEMVEDMHGEGYIKKESWGAGVTHYVVYIEGRGEPYAVMTENDWEQWLTGGQG
jgi:hypothetical protein